MERAAVLSHGDVIGAAFVRSLVPAAATDSGSTTASSSPPSPTSNAA